VAVTTFPAIVILIFMFWLLSEEARSGFQLEASLALLPPIAIKPVTANTSMLESTFRVTNVAEVDRFICLSVQALVSRDVQL
jgi:hypothetical protein